jgi:hypothetical protein
VEAEWDSLATEERLYKKLRAGKITQDEYDELVDAIGHEDDSEQESEDEVVPLGRKHKKIFR